MKKVQFTTVALEENQHLIPQFHSSIVETYCKGYTNNKRDKTLDGHYFTKELKIKTGLNNFNNQNYSEHLVLNVKPL